MIIQFWHATLRLLRVWATPGSTRCPPDGRRRFDDTTCRSIFLSPSISRWCWPQWIPMPLPLYQCYQLRRSPLILHDATAILMSPSPILMPPRWFFLYRCLSPIDFDGHHWLLRRHVITINAYHHQLSRFSSSLTISRYYCHVTGYWNCHFLHCQLVSSISTPSIILVINIINNTITDFHLSITILLHWSLSIIIIIE